MTTILEYLINEASSGTGPAALLDSTPSPLNLPITYGSGAGYTSDSSGDALLLSSATPPTDAIVNASSKVTALAGSKVATAEVAFNRISYTPNGVLNVFTGRLQVYDGGGEFFDYFTFDSTAGVMHEALAYRTAADGDLSAEFVVGLGFSVCYMVLDLSLATGRLRFFDKGFLAATDDTATQNTTLAFSGTGTKVVELGASSRTALVQSENFAALHDVALTSAVILARTLRLFASTDTDPGAAGANLYAASTNGGTNDVSSGTGDHSIQFTITIGAAGLNRKVLICLAYMGVTTGVTVCTFNGSAVGVHLSAQKQSTFATLAGCDVYEILDSSLPGAGTYTIDVTVDGAVGVVCGSPSYMEGVAQSYASNIGLATGTGVSITATLGGPAGAGSIVVGEMLDVSFGDAPVSGSNQLRLIAQSTSSVIEQVVDAKYVPSAGANSMSWTGLTNTTGKIAVAIELALAGTAVDSALFMGNPTLLM